MFVMGENFHPNRTRLINLHRGKYNTNYLFRGNMPVLNGKFCYDKLIDNLKDVLHSHNMTFPTNSYMVDLTYINSYVPGESEDLKAEKLFWDENAKLGQMIHWPIIGSTIRPPADNAVVKSIIKEYMTHSLDRLDLKIPLLQQLLTIEYADVSWLIYSHCEAGVDRTGEVSGSYYMEYKNMSFENAVKVDNSIVNRDMYVDSRNELQWYCYYLKFEKGMKDIICA